jgi:endogenous inhibitor of DNA gyrase (YacG/DUF329 family)
MKSLIVACPKCQKKFNYYESTFRPFCCEKCRLIDLGQWLNESYTVPASKLTLEEAQELEQLLNEKDQINDEDDKLH